VMAECLRGNPEQAYAYYQAYMPSAYNARADVREIEPYVHSQTTYATCSPHVGKSRVPWLTGTASWSYHVALEYILGVRPGVDALQIDPSIPASWSGFEVKRSWRGRELLIRVKNPRGHGRGVRQLRVDSKVVHGNSVPLSLLRDGSTIEVELEG
jgi:N,N'-diacetylchitobiose phosphorylase